MLFERQRLEVDLLHHCNFNCSYCINRARHRAWTPGTVFGRDQILDVDALVSWLERFAPRAARIILSGLSGGEPLLHPRIDDLALKLSPVYGEKLVFFTNGSLIKEHPKLIDVPLGWHITWHPSQISLEEFVEQVTPLKGNHLVKFVALVSRGNMEPVNRLTDALPWAAQITSKPMYFESGSSQPITVHCASGLPALRRTPLGTGFKGDPKHVIQPDGRVLGQNAPPFFGEIGNIYKMTYDLEERARKALQGTDASEAADGDFGGYQTTPIGDGNEGASC